MKEIDRLQPRAFTKFCMSIGAVPSSYIAGLTIEEQLLWFCSYLEKTVIPAVNNNAEAVEELQNLYIQLKDYVDHYFDNLEVQEEINNKLDDMAESGELAEIIAQYLQLNGILAYDSIADMKQATNLVAGSFAETYGYYNYGDGGSAKYKVRQVTNQDVEDDVLIIALHDENLVAELLFTNSMNVEVFGAKGDGTTDDSVAIQKCVDNTINSVVFNQDKIYNIAQPITLKSNIEVNGNKATIKMSTTSSTTIDIFNIDNKENIKIHDFNLINGTNANDDENCDIFISTNRPTTNNCYDIEIYNINYENSDTLTTPPISLIYIGNVYNLNIHNCNIKGNSEASMRGIMIWSTKDIDGVTVNTNSKDIKIYKNIIDGFYRNIESYGTSTNDQYGCRHKMIIESNYIRNATDNGVYAYHGVDSIIKNNYFTECKKGCFSDDGKIVSDNIFKDCEVGLWTEEFENGNITNNTFEIISESAIIVGGGTLDSNISNNTFRYCENDITIDEQYTPVQYYSGILNISNNSFTNTYNHVLELKRCQYSVNFNYNYINVWGLNKDTATDCIYITNKNVAGELYVNNNTIENRAYTNAQPSAQGNCNAIINTGSYSATFLYFNDNVISGTYNYLGVIKVSYFLFVMNNIFQAPTVSPLSLTNKQYSEKYVIKNNTNLSGQNTLADETGGTSMN